jgi:hypothetical protein
VRDERPAGAVAGVEGIQDGPVAAADRVDGLDVGVPVQGVEREPVHGAVQAVAVRDLRQGAVRPLLPDRGPEADLAFLLAAEHAAAQRDQDAAVPLAEPLVDEVGRGGAGRTVVHSDVGHPLAERQVGDQRDDGDAGLG